MIVSIAEIECDDTLLDPEDIPSLGGLSDFERFQYEQEILTLRKKIENLNQSVIDQITATKRKAASEIAALREERVTEAEYHTKECRELREKLAKRGAAIEHLTQVKEMLSEYIGTEGKEKSENIAELISAYVEEKKMGFEGKWLEILKLPYAVNVYHYCLLFLMYVIAGSGGLRGGAGVEARITDAKARAVFHNIRRIAGFPTDPGSLGEEFASDQKEGMATEKEVITILSKVFGISDGRVGEGAVPKKVAAVNGAERYV
jgi:hypothetical protein